MTAPRLHLALNHVPLFATVLAAGFVLYGLLRRDEAGRKLGLYFLVGAALFAVPVYLSGEPAEEVVEQAAGVSHALIHRHEEAAEQVFVLLLLLGAVALAQLVSEWRGWAVRRPVGWGLAVFATVAVVAMARVAHLGGEIRHEEIRRDAGAAIQDVGLSPRTESHEPVDPD